MDCHRLGPPRAATPRQTQEEASRGDTMLPAARRLLHWSGRVLLNLTVVVVLVCIFISLVDADHRVTVYRRNHLQALYRPSCSGRSECPDNSFCNSQQRKCQCKTDFVQVHTFVNKSYISHLTMTCLPIARLNDRCVSSDQCIVDYSECQLITQVVSGANQTSHYCKCIPGHDVRDQDTADLSLNGNNYRLKPVCSWERSTNVTWLSTLILISLLVIFILVGTFVAIVRYQRWRNLQYPATITSIAGHSPALNSHPMGANNHMDTGCMDLPVIGSSEMEFQNDFIQVFPMHHLEPMPDKDAHAFIIR